MTFWLQNGQPECLRACIASIAGVHPDTLPSTNRTLTAELNMEIHAACGKKLEPVYGQRYSDMPTGLWIAMKHCTKTVSHAVVARGSQIVFDPADGEEDGFLYPDDLAFKYDRDLPLGWRLVSA